MPDARGKEGSAGSRRGEQWCYLLPKTEGGNDYQVGGMSCYWLRVTTGGNLVRPGEDHEYTSTSQLCLLTEECEVGGFCQGPSMGRCWLRPDPSVAC